MVAPKNREPSAQPVIGPQKVLDHETDQEHVSANEENERKKKTSQKDLLPRDKPKMVKRRVATRAQDPTAE
jgi:hypothetical protein